MNDRSCDGASESIGLRGTADEFEHIRKRLAEINRNFTVVLSEAIQTIRDFQQTPPGQSARRQVTGERAHHVVQRLRALEAEYKALVKALEPKGS